MDPKTEARELREIANLYDQIAERRDAIGFGAEGARDNAKANRRRADELDPPQPEWQDGDLARDNEGDLWQFGYGNWHLRGLHIRADVMTLNYGPLTRVLTYDPAKQRIADPAQQEVVISLDGINRDALDQWAKWAACEPAEEVCIRAAKAAREQLGEVRA